MGKSVMTLEFGTSKVICAIGRKRSRGRFEIVSLAQVNYAGFKKGRWQELELVPEILKKTIKEAKTKARQNPTRAYIGIPPCFCRVHCASSAMDLIGNNKVITPEIVERMLKNAQRFDVPDEYEMISASPVYFKLDEDNLFVDPVGVEASHIEGQFSFIFAKKRFLYEAKTIMDVLNIPIAGFKPETLCQALFLIPVEERDASSVLLDIGFYDTSVSIVYGDTVIFSRVIPVGGAQITSDLSLVLDIDMESAERIKRRFSFENTYYPQHVKETVRQNGDIIEVDKQMIAEIILSRADHLMHMIKTALYDSRVELPETTKVYLTGAGVSLMTGSVAYLEENLGLKVILPQIDATNYSSPNYHNSIGLLDHVLSNEEI
ncbi:MAG: cell division FtsA domain-containing protein [Eubacteriales bacterium]